jgi:hypothetical protein
MAGLWDWICDNSGKIAIGAGIVCVVAIAVVATGGMAAPVLAAGTTGVKAFVVTKAAVVVTTCAKVAGAAKVVATVAGVAAAGAGGVHLGEQRGTTKERDRTLHREQNARAAAEQVIAAGDRNAQQAAQELQANAALRQELQQVQQRLAQVEETRLNDQRQLNQSMVNSGLREQALRDEMTALREKVEQIDKTQSRVTAEAPPPVATAVPATQNPPRAKTTPAPGPTPPVTHATVTPASPSSTVAERVQQFQATEQSIPPQPGAGVRLFDPKGERGTTVRKRREVKASDTSTDKTKPNDKPGQSTTRGKSHE